MEFIDLISLAIMFPVMAYCLVALYFLTSGVVYLLFGKITLEEYKKITKEFRLGEPFIESSKKIFWFTYTPLYALIIVFRLIMPFDTEGKNFCMILSIIGYLFVLLFSGYTKKNK